MAVYVCVKLFVCAGVCVYVCVCMCTCCLCRSVYMLGPGVYVLNSGCLRVFGGCDIQIPAGLSFSVIENPKSGGVVFFLSFDIQIPAGLSFFCHRKSKIRRGCLFSVFFLSFICLFVVILGQCPDASSKIRRSSTEHIHNPAADVQIHHHAAQIRQPITHTHARHPESGGGSPNVAQRIPQCVVWSIKLCSAPRLMPSVDQIRTVSYLGPICRLPACGQRRADSGRAAGVGGGRRARGRAGGRPGR